MPSSLVLHLIFVSLDAEELLRPAKIKPHIPHEVEDCVVIDMEDQITLDLRGSSISLLEVYSSHLYSPL